MAGPYIRAVNRGTDADATLRLPGHGGGVCAAVEESPFNALYERSGVISLLPDVAGKTGARCGMRIRPAIGLARSPRRRCRRLRHQSEHGVPCAEAGLAQRDVSRR